MRSYLRSDGLIFVVARSGQVYEVRPVGLASERLEKAALDGYLTPLASPVSSLPPQWPIPRRRDRRRAALKLA